jgi:hypothetical protein
MSYLIAAYALTAIVLIGYALRVRIARLAISKAFRPRS